MRHRGADDGGGYDGHGKRNGATAAEAGDHRWSVQRAEKCADAPAGVEPSVADGAGVENALAQRWCDHDPGDHRAEKQRPAYSEKDYRATVTEKMQAFTHF